MATHTQIVTKSLSRIVPVVPSHSKETQEFFNRVYEAAITPLLVDSERVKNRIDSGHYHTQMYFQDDAYKDLCALYSIDKKPFTFVEIQNAMRIHFLHTTDTNRFESPLLLQATSYAIEKKAEAIIIFVKAQAERTLSVLTKRHAFTMYKKEQGYTVMVHRDLNSLKTQLEQPQRRPPVPIAIPSSDQPREAASATSAVRSSDNDLPLPGFYKSCTLMKQYLLLIRNGTKPIEGRINTGMFAASTLKVGGGIRFFYRQNPDDDVQCTILEVKTFKTFKEMLTHYGFKACVPDVPNLEKAVAAYANIPGYPEKERRFGVVAMKLRVDGSGPNGPAFKTQPSQSNQSQPMRQKRSADDDRPHQSKRNPNTSDHRG